MAADKKATIVIKKITVVAGGAHGGAWKVAFADFMTAMMAFFLVMWLTNQATPEQKKSVSDYFSTPSVIEYQFHNFGVELTLEKLFLDLINEPLKTFQAFVTPVDRTPNVMAMGMKKIVMAHMAEQLGAVASDVQVTADAVEFEIPDHLLFERGTANPSSQYTATIEKIKGITTGLENSDISLTSKVYRQSVPTGDPTQARNTAEQRLDLIEKEVKSSLEHESVTVKGNFFIKNDDRSAKERAGLSGGTIRIEIKQQSILPDGSKPKPFVDGLFGARDANKNVYDNFVDQLAQKKVAKKGSRDRLADAIQQRARERSEKQSAEAVEPVMQLPQAVPEEGSEVLPQEVDPNVAQ